MEGPAYLAHFHILLSHNACLRPLLGGGVEGIENARKYGLSLFIFIFQWDHQKKDGMGAGQETHGKVC